MVRAGSRIPSAVATEGEGELERREWRSYQLSAVETETAGGETAGKKGRDVGTLDALSGTRQVIEVAGEVVLGNGGVNFEEERLMMILG